MDKATKKLICGCAEKNAHLLWRGNVVAVGAGLKRKNGRNTGIPCITVVVTKKMPQKQLADYDRIPTQVEAFQTDVIEAGSKFRIPLPLRGGALIKTKATMSLSNAIDPTKRHRPIMPGISVGHYLVTAGTIACIVYDKVSGRPLILSNWHVLVGGDDAEVGDAIYQPGAYDGGTAADRIGSLFRFVPMKWDQDDSIPLPPCPVGTVVAFLANLASAVLRRKTRLQSILPGPKVVSVLTGLPDAQAPSNFVDAAVAELDDGVDYKDTIPSIGKPKSVADADVGMAVRKIGRTTWETNGTVAVVGATARVNYGEGKTATMVDMDIFSAMSQPGDSGSLIMQSGTANAVSLLFAGSDQLTVGCPMAKVLSLLNVRF